MKEILKKLGFYEFDGAYRLDLENNNILMLDFERTNTRLNLCEIKTFITVYPEYSEKVVLNHAFLEGTYHCTFGNFESVVVEIIENTKKVFNFFESESKWEK